PGPVVVRERAPLLVRVGDVGDEPQVGDVVTDRRDLLARAGHGQRVRVVEHDLDRCGPLTVPAVQGVADLLGLAARQRVVVTVVGADHPGRGGDRDQRDYPQREGGPVVARRPGPKAFEPAGHISYSYMLVYYM